MENATQLDAALLRSWRLRLQANKRSHHTIRNYMAAATDLMAWLESDGHSMAVADIRRCDLEAHQVASAERLAEGTVATHHNCLKQLWAFLVEEGEITASPMARMPVPKASEPEVPVLSDADVVALLATCAGPSFMARRDHAILTLLLDSGLRREEITTLTLASLDDLEHGVIAVRGKGGKWRQVAIGHGTAATLDRYLRARRSHPWASRSDRLWLGGRGAIGVRPQHCGGQARAVVLGWAAFILISCATRGHPT